MKKVLSLILVIAVITGIPVTSFAKTSFFQDPDAIQQASESVLMLTCYDSAGNAISSGSGFLAFDDGVIVTNYHVIDGDVASVLASTEDGMYFDINDILCFDATADIAILKTKAKTRLELLRLGSSNSLKKGSRVVAIGSPEGFLNTVSEGLYSGIYLMDTEYILFTAAISHGSSGGALFNEDGEVVGITSATYNEAQNLNFAVPIEKVIALWESYNNGTYTVPLPENITGGAPQMFTTSLIVDGAGIFTSAEITELLAYSQEKSDLCQSDIAVLFVNGIGDYSSIMEYTDDYFDFNGYGYQDTLDGIMLAVDLQNRQFWISTSGKCISVFTDKRLEEIENIILPDLSSGNYFSSAKLFIETCAVIFENSEIYAKVPVHHYVIGCPPDTGLVSYINSELYTALASGTLNDIAKKYNLEECLIEISSTDFSDSIYLEEIKNRGVLKIGVIPNATFTYQDDAGNWMGFDIDLAKYFANKLGLQLEIYKTTTTYRYRDLKNHEYDLLFCGLSTENDLKANIDFSVPYIKSSTGIDKSRKVYSSIEELYADINSQEGYFSGKYLINDYLAGTEYYDEAFEILNEKFYKKAQRLYNNKEYDKARQIFIYLDEYKDSAKYMLLIDARNKTSQSLRFYMKGEDETYTKLLNMISFADTRNVIQDYYIIEFLKGVWKTSDEKQSLQVKYSESEGHYSLSTTLPSRSLSNSMVSIDNNIYSLYNGKESKKVYKFTIISAKAVTVYCYADNSSWNLYRE